jgi:Kazal-type serine protease inhibitor domain
MRTRLRHRAMAALIIMSGLAMGSTGAPAAGVVGRACGGFIGLNCDGRMWCQKPAGQCATPDIMGKCATVPTLCPMILRPVCGCDGKTYINDCLRQHARAQLNHAGICRK